jgi:hypothetical protein
MSFEAARKDICIRYNVDNLSDLSDEDYELVMDELSNLPNQIDDISFKHGDH